MGALSSRIPGIEELPVSELLRHTQTALLLGVTAIAVAPLVEEVVFRGFIFPVLERRWGPVAAVLLTAAMFTSLHVTQLSGSWMAVSLILLVGLVLSLVRALTGALRPAFLPAPVLQRHPVPPEPDRFGVGGVRAFHWLAPGD